VLSTSEGIHRTVLDAVTATPDPTSSLAPVRSLADRDEYGPITGRPGGLFTAPSVPSQLGDCDELGRRLADWVPADHLL
jgi:hypothetical protein